MIGQSQSVVPGRGGDHSALSLGSIQLKQGIARAAFFKTARALEMFELAKNIHASGFRQRDRARRWRDPAFDAQRGRLNISKADGHNAILRRPSGSSIEGPVVAR